MRRIATISCASLVIIFIMSFIACNGGGGSGGDTTSSGGWSINDFAYTWKVYYTGGGYAGHTITIGQNGVATSIAVEECLPAGGTSHGTFTTTEDDYLVCSDAYLRCNSYPAGEYMTSKYRLQIRSATMLKGTRIDTYHKANGTTQDGGTWAIYLTR